MAENKAPEQGTIDAALAKGLGEYDAELRRVKYDKHPNARALRAGFGDGFKNGFRIGSGAAHAGINTIIGKIHMDLTDMNGVKAELIALRNQIQKEASL